MKLRDTVYDITQDLVDAADDFNSEEEHDIPLSQIKPSPFNPIGLYSEDREKEMVSSIKMSGVRSPILCRITNDGFYELIDGHNRVNCAKKAGLTTIPAIIKNYDDEDAHFINIDSIIQQRGFDDLKPSERARIIYDLTENIKKEKLSNKFQNGIEEMKNIINDRTKRRYLRLNRCCDRIKKLVDENKMVMKVALELADLTIDMQERVVELSQASGIKVDEKKAKLIKEKNQSGELSDETIQKILQGKKRSARSTDFSIKIPKDYKETYFEGKNNKEIQEIILQILESYFADKS